jgi:cytochrome c5
MMPRNPGRGTAALLLVVAALLVVATDRIKAQLNPADEQRLAKLDAGPKTIDVSKYPADQQKAYKLFSKKCASCHTIARGVNTEMVLPAEWERYVKRMMVKPNSGISSEEGKALYRFLVYDAAARKTELLRKSLGTLAPDERAAAVEKIKTINPGFTIP